MFCKNYLPFCDMAYDLPESAFSIANTARYKQRKSRKERSKWAPVSEKIDRLKLIKNNI